MLKSFKDSNKKTVTSNELKVTSKENSTNSLLVTRYLLLFLLLVTCYSSLVTIVHAQPPSPYAVDRLSGQRAADFTLKDIHGNTVSLSSFKGKVVLLNFWATWCPPCRAEIPALNKLNQLMKERGLVILGVSTDRAVSDVREFIRNNPINFTVLMDSDSKVSKGTYKVFMIPTSFLIDKRGIIVDKFFGDHDWTSTKIIRQIEGLL